MTDYIIPKEVAAAERERIRLKNQEQMALVAAKNPTAEARVENVQPGVCPVCKEGMEICETTEGPAFTCMEHNVVMPIPNDQLPA